MPIKFKDSDFLSVHSFVGFRCRFLSDAHCQTGRTGKTRVVPSISRWPATSFRNESTCRFCQGRPFLGMPETRQASGLFGRLEATLSFEFVLFFSLFAREEVEEEGLTVSALLLRGAVKRKPRLCDEFSSCPAPVASGSRFLGPFRRRLFDVELISWPANFSRIGGTSFCLTRRWTA